jgi:hypothetical protein
MSKDPHINETIEQLRLLAMSQDEALRVSKEIISMKNRMIEICELETAIYKRQASKHGVTVLILSVMLIITSVLLLCNL